MYGGAVMAYLGDDVLDLLLKLISLSSYLTKMSIIKLQFLICAIVIKALYQ